MPRKAGRGAVHITDRTTTTTTTKTLYKKCEALFGIVSLTGKKLGRMLGSSCKGECSKGSHGCEVKLARYLPCWVTAPSSPELHEENSRDWQ